MRCKWLALACALGVAGGLVGCGRTRDARLLEVHGVEPQLLERGDSLRVLGEGFPAGHTGEAQLRGVLHRAGEAPQRVRVTLPAVAVRADRVDIALDDAALARIGAPGSFDGTLELSFAAARDATRVTGDASVSLDFLGAHADARPQAEALLTQLGIEVADGDLLRGLRVAQISEHSVAERAGLRAGDVITSASGVRVHALADLAPKPGATRLALGVSRPGAAVAQTIDLPLMAAIRAQSWSPRTLAFGALGCFLLLVVVFASPLPSPTPFVARALDALPALRRTVLAPAAFAGTAMLAPVALALTGLGGIDAFAVLAVVLLLASWLVLREDRSRARLQSLAGHAAVLLGVLGCACASAGTRELAGLVAQQGVAPFSWKLCTHPELTLGVLLFLAHAVHVLPDPGAQTTRARQLYARAVSSLCAMLLACVFFGGSAVRSDRLDPLWLGASWLLVKTAGVLALLTLARLLAGTRARPKRSALLLALVAFGTGASIVLAPARDTELAVGAIVGSSALVALVIAALEARLLAALDERRLRRASAP
ncbi:MAG TPA: PDZ domain-containing protein [Polyangiales bacterium]|nr:PDZ domain-containing protein [Polyangiales bacterium]